MKILLDENIDVNFKVELAEYDVNTVRDSGWTGIENGKLLNLAIKGGYNVFISLDSNLKYQQNLSGTEISIIILKSKDSRLSSIKLFLPDIKHILNKISSAKQFEVFEINL